ncbi:MAG TPA: hypothetical protein VJT81_00405 [Burkholderiales bacterium]|nr:hypothetical protein [Burkholderiales bacterium]
MNLERIQLMPLAQRGLFATLRWKIWANDSLPRDPDQLARLLGLDPQEVRGNLSEAVLSFFSVDPANSTRLFCPELSAQKKSLAERRRKQSEGGENGANNRWDKEKEVVATPVGKPVAKPMASELKGNAVQRAKPVFRGSPITSASQDDVQEMRRAFGELP